MYWHKPEVHATLFDWKAKKVLSPVWVFFHDHSQFTGQQEKGEGISLTPLYHFHPLYRHLDIELARQLMQSAHFCTELAVGLETGTFDFRAQVANH